MISLQLPDVNIDVYDDGDWLIRAKHTGFIQLPKSIIDFLLSPTKPRKAGDFPPKAGGWPLTIETPHGPQTTVYRTRDAYRAAKRAL